MKYPVSMGRPISFVLVCAIGLLVSYVSSQDNENPLYYEYPENAISHQEAVQKTSGFSQPQNDEENDIRVPDSRPRHVQHGFGKLGAANVSTDHVTPTSFDVDSLGQEVDVDQADVVLNHTARKDSVKPTISFDLDVEVAGVPNGESSKRLAGGTPSGNSTTHMQATIHMDHHVVQELRALVSGDFHWTDWGSWSQCSLTCGSGGWRVRHRYCGQGPVTMCPDSDVSTSACPVTRPCAVEWGTSMRGLSSVWMAWSAWSDCSATCGVGEESQNRKCVMSATSTSSPSDCPGKRHRFRHCLRPDCQGDGGTVVAHALEGHKTRLHCQYKSSQPVLGVYWVTPHGQRVEQGQHNNRYHVHGDYLTVTHAEDYDVGGYTCVVMRTNNRNETSDVSLALSTCTHHYLCHNGGTCVEMPETPARPFPYISCVCVVGYTGQFCESHSNKPLLTAMIAIFFVLSLVILTFLCAFKSNKIPKDLLPGGIPGVEYIKKTPPVVERKLSDDLVPPVRNFDPKSFSDLAKRPLPNPPDLGDDGYINIAQTHSEWNARDPLLANESNGYMAVGEFLDHTYVEADSIFPHHISVGTSVCVNADWSTTSTRNNSVIDAKEEEQLGSTDLPNHYEDMASYPKYRPSDPRARECLPEGTSRPRPMPREAASPTASGPSMQPIMGISSLGSYQSPIAETEPDDGSDVYVSMTQLHEPPDGSSHERRLTLMDTDPGSPMYPWSPRAARAGWHDSPTVNKQYDPPDNDSKVSNEKTATWRSPRGPHPDDRLVDLGAGSSIVQGTSPRLAGKQDPYKNVVDTIKTITEVREIMSNCSPGSPIPETINNMTFREINEILASPHVHGVQNLLVTGADSVYSAAEAASGGSTIPAGGLRSPRKRLFESSSSLDALVGQNNNNHNTTEAMMTPVSSSESIEPTSCMNNSPRKTTSEDEIKDMLLTLWKESLHS